MDEPFEQEVRRFIFGLLLTLSAGFTMLTLVLVVVILG